MRQQTLRFGDAWARLGPWRGGGHIAHLVVAPDVPLSGAAILDCVERARAAGYDEVLTSAMGPAEGEPFVEARFTVRERLHLLTHEMDGEPAARAAPVTRATRRDRRCGARPSTTSRSTPSGGSARSDCATRSTPRPCASSARRGPTTEPPLTGYAITGRAGNQGYLQRIAVHPARGATELGRTLVADAMHWLWRQGVMRSYVNTQLDNQRRRSRCTSRSASTSSPAGLAVLGRSL